MTTSNAVANVKVGSVIAYGDEHGRRVTVEALERWTVRGKPYVRVWARGTGSYTPLEMSSYAVSDTFYRQGCIV